MNTKSAANLSGAVMEHMIACFLEQIGCPSEQKYRPGCRNLNGGELEIDVFIPAIPRFPQGLGIEVKWQNSSGSNYQKLVYSVQNIKACYPCPGVLVYCGKAFRSGAAGGMIDWCKSQVEGNLVAVVDVEEFQTWLMTGQV